MTRVPVQPGTVIGDDFEIERPLAEGGFGAVYVAKQRSTRAKRAVKLMHPGLISDPKLLSRFAQEAQVSAELQSDHVVQVIAAGVDAASGRPWLAMELLEGEDLGAHVAKSGPLEPNAAKEVLSQLCHGLGAAHARGVVHRDIKPENIFLATARRTGVPFTVKVLDFGIAKMAFEAKTAQTASIGTPLWMAPEQTSPDGVIGPTTDVWALGLLAFWLLTGTAYWRNARGESANVPALMREMLFDEMAPASTRIEQLGSRAVLPPGFDTWFAKCTARDPRGRYSDAAKAMEGFLGTVIIVPTTSVRDAVSPALTTVTVMPGGATGVTPGTPAAIFQPAPAAAGNRTPLYVMAGVVAVLVLGGGAFVAMALGSDERNASQGEGCPDGTELRRGKCRAVVERECPKGMEFESGRGCVPEIVADDDDDDDDRDVADREDSQPPDRSPKCDPGDPLCNDMASNPLKDRKTPDQTPTKKKRAPPPPPPPPKKKTSAVCNCAPDDLMCNMRCSQR